MHKTVFVAIAALCLTAPSLVQAAERVRAPAGRSVGHRFAAHAMIQRQRFNRTVGASQARFHNASTNPSHGMVPHWPNQNMPASPGFHSASPGHIFPHAPGQTPTASADHLHNHKDPITGLPIGPGTNPGVSGQIKDAKQDQTAQDRAIDHFRREQERKAQDRAIDQFRRRLRERAAATDPTGTTTPPTGTGGTGTTTPPTGTGGTPPPTKTTVCIDCKIVRPGGGFGSGGFGGGSGGGGSSGGQVSGGGSGAPGAPYPAAPANPDPGYPAPRYTAQPVTDKPVCLSGTFATQNQQQQYVCLSWFYQGRIYTPDQLEQVLAQR
jgi:hypothetical protein